MIVVHIQLLPKEALTVCTWVVLISSKGGCVDCWREGNQGGCSHGGMPNQFRSDLKPIRSVYTEISLAQTGVDPTHRTM